MKRIFDFFIAVLLLILVSPLLIVTMVLVAIFLGQPVIFSQSRPGYRAKLFNLFKIRSMTNELDEDGNRLPDEKRLTTFGRWLRALSLDELPSLWNVIKGDMSLVGPRPLLEEYLILYSTEQNRRHNVKPGITGWAQINGRNAISWDDKFKYDIWYVDNHSFWLDLKILLLTLKKVVLRDGINEKGNVTMSKFTGNY